MKKSEDLRKKANNCAEMAQAAESKPEQRRFERLAEGWSQMAEVQAWLDGEKHEGARTGEGPRRPDR